MTTTFDKNLLNLVKSVHSIEEFSERIVRSAVTEAITSLSQKYGLNSAALLADMVESLVAKHAHTTVECPSCKATTARGNKCTKDALVDGYCQLHSRQHPHKNKKRPLQEGRGGGHEETVSKITRLLRSVKETSAEDPRP